MSAKYEPLVPLAEFGLERLDTAELAAWSELADFTVQRDYLDRPAISLADAYALGEARRKAEHEWRNAESRRLAEHAAAVQDLQRACNSAFSRARDEFLTEHAGQPFWSGIELQGQATNHGLEAARQVWLSADDQVRQEIVTVQAEESGTLLSFELGMTLPRAIQDSYIRKAARRA